MPSCLLLVDCQYDFLPGGALAVPQGDAILPKLNEMLCRPWDVCVFSQDYHPPGHASFASRHGKDPFVSKRRLADGSEDTLWPDHCVQGTRGAALHDDLQAAIAQHPSAGPLKSTKAVYVVQKAGRLFPMTLVPLTGQQGEQKDIEAYSAFHCRPLGTTASDAPGSHLTGVLRSHRVDRVFVVGLATDYCVKASALSALQDGFETVVLQDACRGISAETADAAIQGMRQSGITVTTSDAAGLP